jgi:hypothetical protein
MSIMIGGSYGLLDLMSHGHFHQWVFTWTARHGMDAWHGVSRMLHAAATRGPVLFVLLIGTMITRPKCRWTWCLAAAVGLAILGMSKRGGLENHLYPAVLVAAVITGRWVGSVWLGTRRWRLRDRTQYSVPSTPWAAIAILLAVMWPGLPLRRDFRWVARRDKETREWVQTVRRLDGRVAVGHHLLLARQAGAECVFSDLILQFPGLAVPTPVRDLIASRQFDYLILGADPSTSPTPGWGDLIADHYTAAGELDCPNRSGVLPRRVYAARLDREHAISRFASPAAGEEAAAADFLADAM